MNLDFAPGISEVPLFPFWTMVLTEQKAPLEWGVRPRNWKPQICLSEVEQYHSISWYCGTHREGLLRWGREVEKQIHISWHVSSLFYQSCMPRSAWPLFVTLTAISVGMTWTRISGLKAFFPCEEQDENWVICTIVICVGPSMRGPHKHSDSVYLRLSTLTIILELMSPLLRQALISEETRENE